MPNAQIAVATRKGLFRFEGSGSTWRIAARDFLGEMITAALASPDRTRWLVALRMGHYGVKLRASGDGGATWQEVAPPAYPPKPQDTDDANPWTLDQVWVLEGFHPRVPDRLWAGTIPGGLFRSDDAGRSWTLMESLWRMPERLQWFGGGAEQPGIHSICVHPQDPDDIVVSVSCGGVWRTRDGGTTWTVGRGLQASYMPPERRDDPVIQDPHRIVQCEAQPDVLWMQNHCGIWKSVDRGATWNEVTGARPTGFGFAVVVHPRDPARAWFAPLAKDEQRMPLNGEVVASRTLDGGRSFEVLRKGLPAGEAYSMIYRHGLDISADGAQLAMASTTGDLWIGDGERWAEITRGLPPVYAVRWT